MHPILVDGPAVEPVTLAEMKTYLRVDDDAQDELISGLIKAARLMVEAVSRRILIEQSWRIALDSWPQARTIVLPLSPLIAVTRVQVFDALGIASDAPAGAFEVEALSDPPRIFLTNAPDPGRARNGIFIDLRAGYGADPGAVPAPLRLAVKILVARWFENRGDVAGEQMMPPEALSLIAPFQRARL
ncbi:head-tail connector protein [Microvirga flavescens]|uniref:head-tail connector protein n=1 Tax=Microvirga flavescens TaxID=2249811 RepID=UPI000DD59086|nr:head-tail connector protein [Microvirga flavescens]